jgi:hypothetical protein
MNLLRMGAIMAVVDIKRDYKKDAMMRRWLDSKLICIFIGSYRHPWPMREAGGQLESGDFTANTC